MMLQIRPDGVAHFTPVRVAHNVPESLAHYAPVEVVHYAPVCSKGKGMQYQASPLDVHCESCVMKSRKRKYTSSVALRSESTHYVD